MKWLRRWLARQFDSMLREAGEVADEAGRLRDAGRIGEAVTTGERALAAARDLARASRVRALPLLTLTLRNQSVLLAEAGQRRAALELAEEAVERGRELYAIDQGQAPHLADALVQLADRLVSAGRPGEALIRSREAGEVAGGRSDERLGEQLGALARSLFAAGQHAEALEQTERALDIWRALVADAPPGSRAAVEYGRTLAHYGVRLHRTGRWDEAVRASTEAVDWFRALRTRRVGMDGLLVLALVEHSAALDVVGRRDEALWVAEEAVTVARGMTGTHPGYRAPLAAALKAHSERLSVDHRTAEALPAATEALTLYRELEAAERGAYRTGLAEAVSNVAEIGDDLALAEEAVELYRELATANPAQLRRLVRALRVLAEKQTGAGRLEDALATGEEGLSLGRELADDSLFLLLPYANLLHEQAERLDRAGRAADALALGTEAVAAARQVHSRPGGHGRGLLGKALRAQAARISADRHATGNDRRRARSMLREADGLGVSAAT